MTTQAASLPGLTRTQHIANPWRVAGRTLIYAILGVGTVIMLFPLIWMVLVSLDDNASLFNIPPQYIPAVPHWSNYPQAVTVFPFARYFLNTMIITGTAMVGLLFSCTLVGYSFARLRWPGRDVFFIIMLATLMVPPQVTMIPLYIIWRQVGALDTYAPLIVPAFFGNAYLIFFTRQFFTTIPFELEDAARVDGCGYFTVYFRIMLPLSLPLMVTLGLFAFTWNWNDFFGPLIYLTSPSKYTLQLGLLSFNGQY
ncbi:MAG TPA: carbohydrate ABC transporter permease, partial [Chloroflexota bacterium]|nr:carbohydrate ABC transporter permease [Chloroflexota bacterium]